jgi:biopolymer transport protein ExbD
MKFRNHTQIEALGLQIAPLVDVLILLLSFFVVTWKFSRIESEISISVPTSDQGQPLNREYNQIVINVRQDGQALVDAKPINDEELIARFGAITAANPNVAVIVRGDQEAAYKHIFHVLETCKKAGVWNVSFMTRPGESTPPAAPQ